MHLPSPQPAPHHSPSAPGLSPCRYQDVGLDFWLGVQAERWRMARASGEAGGKGALQMVPPRHALAPVLPGPHLGDTPTPQPLAPRPPPPPPMVVPPAMAGEWQRFLRSRPADAAGTAHGAASSSGAVPPAKGKGRGKACGTQAPGSRRRGGKGKGGGAGRQPGAEQRARDSARGPPLTHLASSAVAPAPAAVLGAEGLALGGEAAGAPPPAQRSGAKRRRR